MEYQAEQVLVAKVCTQNSAQLQSFMHLCHMQNPTQLKPNMTLAPALHCECHGNAGIELLTTPAL